MIQGKKEKYEATMKNTGKRDKGLTLIELMVTIAIIGILAAIAIPSYSYYTRVSTRSAAKSSLQQVRGLLEQYYTNNKSYTTDLANLGFQNSPLEVNKTGQEATSGIKYEITVHTLAANNMVYCKTNCDYEVIATAQNTQTKDTNCVVFVFNSLGQKTSYKSDKTTISKDCW